jgi:hypothetical protein
MKEKLSSPSSQVGFSQETPLAASFTQNTREGTPLYRRVIARANNVTLRKVWGKTPWMLKVKTGSPESERYLKVTNWCHDKLGQESCPLRAIEGVWRFGGVTILGETWIGFSTRELMISFKKEFKGSPY